MEENIISIRHLCKEYPGVTPLKDVSVEIKKGEVISVIGPSGTGKSTLLRCINLLEKPTKGEIVVDGVVITDKKCKVNLVRQKMGMVFQSFNLFAHKTVIENIMMGQVDLLGRSRKEAYDRGMELLRTVGLVDKALAYPDELSGGQKQRVSIAGVIAMHPKCIILDEPTAMLDPNGRKEVIRAVRALNDVEGITVILITHYMEEIIHADMVYVMDKGHVAMEGTPREIFSRVEELKALRLDVPQVTELAYGLRRKGVPLSPCILDTAKLVRELVEIRRQRAAQ